MTFLRSQLLFDHCGVFDSDTSASGNKFEDLSSERSKIEPNNTSDLMADNALIGVTLVASSGAITESYDDYCPDVCSIINSDCCDTVQDTHDELLSSSNGFIISDDDHFITFDSSNGACDWGCDMSMNADF